MKYQYKCLDCGSVFDLEVKLQDYKEQVPCLTCDGGIAPQYFTADGLPSVKVYNNNITKNITFDKE